MQPHAAAMLVQVVASQALQRRRQPRGAQCHTAGVGRQPDEAAAPQALSQQAHAVAVAPEQLDLDTAADTEGENVAGLRFFVQHGLRLDGQTVDSATHLGNLGGQSDP